MTQQDRIEKKLDWLVIAVKVIAQELAQRPSHDPRLTGFLGSIESKAIDLQQALKGQ